MASRNASSGTFASTTTLPAAGQVDDEVGALGAVVAGEVDLLGEVAAVDQPGQLDAAAQVQLAPPAAHLWLAQRRRQRAGLAAEQVGAVPHVVHLLAQLALPGDALVGEVLHLVVQPVEALEDLGALQPAVDVRRAPAHPEHPERRPDREAEREREEEGQWLHASNGARHHRQVELGRPHPDSGAAAAPMQ